MFMSVAGVDSTGQRQTQASWEGLHWAEHRCVKFRSTGCVNVYL